MDFCFFTLRKNWSSQNRGSWTVFANPEQPWYFELIMWCTNLWITIDITLFTCTKLADLRETGLYLVVETDGWRLQKSFLFNEAYKNFPLRISASTWTDFNCYCIRSRLPTFETILKGGFLIVEMANTCLWSVSKRKHKPSKSNIRDRDSPRREDFRLLSHSLAPFSRDNARVMLYYPK